MVCLDLVVVHSTHHICVCVCVCACGLRAHYKISKNNNKTKHTHTHAHRRMCAQGKGEVSDGFLCDQDSIDNRTSAIGIDTEMKANEHRILLSWTGPGRARKYKY